MLDLLTLFAILIVLLAVYALGQLVMAEVLHCRVRRLQVGWGPLLATFTLGRTTFTLRAFALGSEMQFFGSDFAEIHLPIAEQPLIRRVLIMIAGPTALLVVSWFSLALFIACYGVKIPSTTTIVGNVIEGKPVAKAGLAQGDVVLAVDGQPLADWDALAKAMRSRIEQQFSLTVIREDIPHTFSVTPSGEKHSSSESLLVPESIMGLQRASHPAQVGLRSALLLGAKESASLGVTMLRGLVGVVSEGTRWKPLPETMPNPFVSFGKTKHFGIQAILYSFGWIGSSLGLLNLLPLPNLNGGEVLRAFLEALRGRSFTPRQIEVAQRVGLLVLAGFMLLALYHDISTVYRDVIQRRFPNR